MDREETKRILDIDIHPAKGGELRKLTLSDITLHVRVPWGSTQETDVNCDIKFMMSTIHEIGKAICAKMCFVPRWNPIHLIIDNAGGHGMNKGKDKYEKILHEKILRDTYNIILKWQVPNSPETNMLDLGAWMTIQSEIEELHLQRLMNEDALTDLVIQAFKEFDNCTKLATIANRWELVLDLI